MISWLLGLVVLVLDIVAIIDVLSRSGDALKKVLWILLILILPVLGMIAYFLLGRAGKDRLA